MRLDAFADRHGVMPGIESGLYADLWLREQRERRRALPLPEMEFRHNGLLLVPVTAIIQHVTNTRLAGFSAANALSGSSTTALSGHTGIVAAGWSNSGTATSVSGITWGGVSMTIAQQQYAASGSAAMGVALAYISNPPAGVSTVALSFPGNYVSAFALVALYSGMASAPLDTATNNPLVGAGTTNYSGNATTSVANAFVISTVQQQVTSTTAPAAGTNMNRRQAGTSGFSPAMAWAAGDVAVAAAGTAAVVNWSGASSFNWLETNASFKPGPAMGSLRLSQAVNRASTY